LRSQSRSPSALVEAFAHHSSISSPWAHLELTLAHLDSPNIAEKTALLAFPKKSKFYSG